MSIETLPWGQMIESANLMEEYMSANPHMTEDELTDRVLRLVYPDPVKVEALTKASTELEALKAELSAQVYANPYSYAAKTGADGKLTPGIRIIPGKGVVDEVSVEYLVEFHLLPEALEKKRAKALTDALRIHEEAAKAKVPQPRYASLAEAFKDDTRTPALMRVDGLVLLGGNTLLSAQAKAGKTSLMVNYVKALVDGTPFLDREVIPVEGNVVYWDLEQEENYSIDHFQKIGLEHPEKVVLVPGAGMSISMASDQFKRETVQQLIDANAEVWIIDTMSQAFNGDPDKEADVAPWLNHVKEIKQMAGVRDLIIIGHAGHNKDDIRQRGSSFFLGAFDSLWTFGHESGEGSSRRVFKSKGRNVQQEKITCDWDMYSNGYYTVEHKVSKEEAVKEDMSGLLAYLLERGPASVLTIGTEYYGKSPDDYTKWRSNLSRRMSELVAEGCVTKETRDRITHYVFKNVGIAV